MIQRATGNRNATRGFTLLEVLVAVTIMVIISLMLIGGTNALVANQRFTSSSDRVISTLHLARNLAITHNAIYHVRIQNYPVTAAEESDITTKGKFPPQTISVYCYPRANDALAVQKYDPITRQPKDVDVKLNWNPRSGPATADFRNYRVADVALERGIFLGIQGPNGSIAPDDSVIYFLPDGTASSSQTLFLTNQKMLADLRFSEHVWLWTDRNDVRRAMHNGTLKSYVPPAAPGDLPTATSIKDTLPPNSDINMIQVYQGGMIRFLKQERLP